MEGSGHNSRNGNAVTNEQYLLEQLRQQTVLVNEALVRINILEVEVTRVTGQLEQSMQKWNELFQMCQSVSEMLQSESELVDRFVVRMSELQLELRNMTSERDQLKQRVEDLELRNNAMLNDLHP